MPNRDYAADPSSVTARLIKAYYNEPLAGRELIAPYIPPFTVLAILTGYGNIVDDNATRDRRDADAILRALQHRLADDASILRALQQQLTDDGTTHERAEQATANFPFLADMLNDGADDGTTHNHEQ